MKTIHVVPENDLREHGLTTECVCSPLVENLDSGGVRITHHAFDLREKLERQGLKTGNRWKVVVDEN